MSTKKNLFFNTVLETRPLIQAIILNQVIQFEETQCQQELADLRELVRQKEEAIALASLQDSKKILESQETQDDLLDKINNVTLNVDLDTKPTEPMLEEEVAAEQVLRNPLLDMVLPSEESIIEKYRTKVNAFYQVD